MKKRLAIVAMLLCCTVSLTAGNLKYSTSDSLKICEILEILSLEKEKKTSSLMISAGKMFIGTPYVAGTLDKEKMEKIVVKPREVDCTTLVEQVFAIAKSINQGKKDFSTFCDNLQLIRYRNGRCNGYESRLHYFTQWAADAEKKGIAQEVGGKQFSGRQALNLSFMSNNADKYAQLKEDSTMTAAIARAEQPFRGVTINYLPKEILNKGPKQLPVKNGDIIALVTNIKGLDVTHMGIAVWVGNKLHMLHASYNKKKVIIDDQTLYDYLKTRKSAPGIRIVRVK